MWGGDVVCDASPNRVQSDCLIGLAREVRRFCSISLCLERFDWGEFYQVRSIDYKGDEVKIARTFTWANLAPALPREVGRVPLADLCTLGSRHYVEHFDFYLKPRCEWKLPKPPRVMVEESDWVDVCKGLVASRVCTFIEEAEVFHTDQGPLLNGLFGVSKEEWTEDGTEIFRLIMNLVPLNSLCRPMSGDVDTLPAWSGMSPFFIQPTQCLLVSSEDVKCFFYTLAVPPCWVKYLAFNRLVPNLALPPHLQGRRVYLASVVLPMGFLNSVSLAQHVHRNLVLANNMAEQGQEPNAPEHELRKDRPFPSGSSLWRVYLDNYDLLEKVEFTEMVAKKDSLAPGVLALRQEYERWEVPRNFKKSVQRSPMTEVQGATVDGVAGVAYPREAKLLKYFSLAVQLCSQRVASQKQWQVACGGLVYFAMFRWPLLGSLNQVWQHIVQFDNSGARVAPVPADCRLGGAAVSGMSALGPHGLQGGYASSGHLQRCIVTRWGSLRQYRRDPLRSAGGRGFPPWRGAGDTDRRDGSLCWALWWHWSTESGSGSYWVPGHRPHIRWKGSGWSPGGGDAFSRQYCGYQRGGGHRGGRATVECTLLAMFCGRTRGRSALPGSQRTQLWSTGSATGRAIIPLQPCAPGAGAPETAFRLEPSLHHHGGRSHLWINRTATSWAKVLAVDPWPAMRAVWRGATDQGCIGWTGKLTRALWASQTFRETGLLFKWNFKGCKTLLESLAVGGWRLIQANLFPHSLHHGRRQSRGASLREFSPALLPSCRGGQATCIVSHHTNTRSSIVWWTGRMCFVSQTFRNGNWCWVSLCTTQPHASPKGSVTANSMRTRGWPC